MGKHEALASFGASALWNLGIIFLKLAGDVWKMLKYLLLCFLVCFVNFTCLDD